MTEVKSRKGQMKSKHNLGRASKSGLVLLLILLMVSGSHFAYAQRKVPEKDRIPLSQDASNEGTWESNDVSLDYSYVRQAGKITITFDGRAKAKYDQLIVRVVFIDEQGKILDRKTVYNSGFRGELSRSKKYRKKRFEKSFDIPPQATHMAFQSLLKPYVGR